jgi:TonB family protein
VKKVIDDHLDEITSCYEKALVTGRIEGRIVYEWLIDSSGNVENISILSSTVPQTDLVACIKSSIKTWRFPKPKDGKAIVSYPFVFDINEL